jgi:hypothetical protein
MQSGRGFAMAGKLAQVVQAQHADIVRAHRVVVAGRRRDGETLGVDAQRQIAAHSGEKALVGQGHGGVHHRRAGFTLVHRGSPCSLA